MAGFFLPGENPMQPRSLLMRVPGPRVAWKESVGRDGWEGARGASNKMSFEPDARFAKHADTRVHDDDLIACRPVL